MKSTPNTPEFGNGLVLLIRIDKSTEQIWVKTSFENIKEHTSIIFLNKKDWKINKHSISLQLDAL